MDQSVQTPMSVMAGVAALRQNPAVGLMAAALLAYYLIRRRKERGLVADAWLLFLIAFSGSVAGNFAMRLAPPMQMGAPAT